MGFIHPAFSQVSREGIYSRYLNCICKWKLFDAVKFDYPQKKVTMIRETKRQNVKPNFAILDFHPIINYKVKGEIISGLVDTGSPLIYLFSSKRWDPQQERVVRSVEKISGNYKYTAKYYEFPLFFPEGLDGNYQIQILPKRPLPHRFEKDSVLGNDIWLDKTLVIDFKNRLVRFEKEE